MLHVLAFALAAGWAGWLCGCAPGSCYRTSVNGQSDAPPRRAPIAQRTPSPFYPSLILQGSRHESSDLSPRTAFRGRTGHDRYWRLQPPPMTMPTTKPVARRRHRRLAQGRLRSAAGRADQGGADRARRTCRRRPAATRRPR